MYLRTTVPAAAAAMLLLTGLWLAGCDAGPAGLEGPRALTLYPTPASADLMVGSAVTVRVSVVRTGVTGPVTVRAAEPASGLQVDTARVGNEDRSASVRITAEPETPLGERYVTLVGEGPGGVQGTAVVGVRVRSRTAVPFTVAAGYEHTCALAGMTIDNPSGPWAVRCWGRNDLGQLGDGTTDDSVQPVPVWMASDGSPVPSTQVVAGAHHTCALDRDGGAWCWGANGAGQIGDGTTTDRSWPTPVQGGHTFVQLAAGGDPGGRGGHTCGLLASGEALCWGANTHGQLGTGGAASPVPVRVAGAQRFIQLTAGGAHTCAVAWAGEAWCWGDDEFGQLGTGTGSSPVPAPVSGGLAFSQLAASGAGGTHTCGIAANGGVHCWGSGARGQLGTGDTPVGVKAPEPVTEGDRYVRITAGWGHTCGSPEPDAVDEPFEPNPPWCWGLNAEGQVGDGTTGDHLIPTRVDGRLLHFMDLASGGGHTCGREIGFATRVYCWGDNGRGQLGAGSGTERSTVPLAVAFPGW